MVEFILANKKILILSEGFGTGHTQAAYALSVCIEQSCAEISTHVMELGSSLHPILAPIIFSAFKKTISSQPRLYGRLYRYQHQKTFNRFTQLALHKLFYAQTTHIIGEVKPDIIICTHPFPSVVVSRLKRNGLHIPLFTVITDYDVHGTWVSREVNKYLVSTEEVKSKLMKHGILPRSIEVTGIPVHPSFRQQHDLMEIRSQFGLQAMPTVLIMGGGWGMIGNIEQFAHMTSWSDRIQLIFCLGHNHKMLQKMSEDIRFQHPHIKLLGYTKEIGKLMEVSDLLITKPGGMTCSEGLAREIPMLFYDTVYGQEEENLSYFINEGFGEKIHSAETIELWFHHLVENHAFIQEKRKFIHQKNSESKQTDCSQMIIDTLYPQTS
jgi:processive 1,2-diacylglycerol beta-glucosyltransferase